MKKLCFITDTHIGQPTGPFSLVPRLLGVHSGKHTTRLKALVDNIKARPDYEDLVVVHLGDVTDRGTKREYEEAEKELKRLKDVIILPGNHDFSSAALVGNGYSKKSHYRFLDFAGRVMQHPAEYPYVRHFDGWKFIGLDSTAHNEEGNIFAQGRIGTRQLAFLATEVASRIPTIIGLHHSPKGGNPLLWLSDREDFLSIVNKKHVFCVFGHLHSFNYFPATPDSPEMLGLDASYKNGVEPYITIPDAALIK